MKTISVSFILYRFFALLLLGLLLSLCSPSVYADGGAPQLAYIAGTTRGVSVIDIARQHVTETIAVAGDPHTVLLSLDGRVLYVTQPILGRVIAILAKTGKTLCTVSLPGQPSLMALSLDATTLYVAGHGDTRVRALDPTTCSILRTFKTQEAVYGLAIAASTAANATPSTPNQLWIAGSTSLTVFEVNGHLLGNIPIAGGPQYICIPSGFTAYVTTRQGTLVAVDLNTRQLIRTLLTQGNFGPMDYDATTGEVYVPDKQHNRLDVLVPIMAGAVATPREPTRVIQLDTSPQSIAITSDGQLGFVALSGGHTLMLDIPKHRIITDITVGGSPHFIITGLYPPVNSPSSPKKAVLASTSATRTVLFGLLGVILLTMFWLFWRQTRKRFAGP